MIGFKVFSVIALVVAISALTEGRAAIKRDADLDKVVRALQAFVEKKQVKKQVVSEEELTADDVMYYVNKLEDELFLQKMLDTQPGYDYICLHFMRWLRAHNRAMAMAEANKPESAENNDNGNSTVRALLKRVLFKIQRGMGGNSTESAESTASPETVEQVSDESDATIEEEEDGVEWVGYLASCWLWELMVHGDAPDFPYWLWAIY